MRSLAVPKRNASKVVPVRRHRPMYQIALYMGLLLMLGDMKALLSRITETSPVNIAIHMNGDYKEYLDYEMRKCFISTTS